MKKRISTYLKYLESLDYSTPDKELAQKILVQIQLAQHERLVHLMVTLAFGIFEMAAMVSFFIACVPYAFFVMLGILALLIPYIFHYYFLENSVQKMYTYYDKAAGEKFMS